MSNNTPTDRLDTYEKQNLRLTKYVLLFILLGFCLIGRRIGAWPIMTWPMYSSRWPEYPESTITVRELRVEDSQGNWNALKPLDLFPMDRVNVVDKVIEAAWADDNPANRKRNRHYLTQLVQQTLNDTEIRQIQAWEVMWDVDPLAVPPLDYRNPSAENLVGRFDVSLKTSSQRTNR